MFSLSSSSSSVTSPVQHQRACRAASARHSQRALVVLDHLDLIVASRARARAAGRCCRRRRSSRAAPACPCAAARASPGGCARWRRGRTPRRRPRPPCRRRARCAWSRRKIAATRASTLGMCWRRSRSGWPTSGPPSKARTATRVTWPSANSSTCSASGNSISLTMYSVTICSGQIAKSTAKPSLAEQLRVAPRSGARADARDAGRDVEELRARPCRRRGWSRRSA